MRQSILKAGQFAAKSFGGKLSSTEEAHCELLDRYFHSNPSSTEGNFHDYEKEILFGKNKAVAQSAVLPKIFLGFVMPELNALYGKSLPLTSQQQSGLALYQGSLVPNGMLRSTAEPASLFALTTRIPGGDGETKWPQWKESDPVIPDDNDADSTEEFNEIGEAQVNWTAEGAQSKETEPKFAPVVIKSEEISGYTEVGLAFYNRAGDNFPEMLRLLFRTAILHKIDQSIISGNSSGNMQGFLNGGILTVNRVTPNQIGIDELTDMECALAPQYRSRAVWVMSKTAFQHLKKKKDLQNMPLFPKLGGPNPTLNEYPVIITQRGPALGTEGDISLGDFSQYVCAVEEDFYVAVSPFAKSSQRVVCCRSAMILGGKVVRPRAFVKLV